ncbi:tegument protein VP22 [Human alphaherpesvirus 1]|nr:tegument protein VP22 [Human alphaherpesvirus 1]
MTSRRSVKSGPREVPRDEYEDLYYTPSSGMASPDSPPDTSRRGALQTRSRQRGEVRFVQYDESDYALYGGSSSEDDEHPEVPRTRRPVSGAVLSAGPARAPPPPAGSGEGAGRTPTTAPRGPRTQRVATKAPAAPAAETTRGRKSAQPEIAALPGAPASTWHNPIQDTAQGAGQKSCALAPPPNPDAPWTPGIGFNKRVFCAAVGRLAAMHARMAAVQLWDMSRPRTDEDLNELLGITTIRVTVCEGKNLLQRANELVNPDVVQDVDAATATRGRSAASRPTERPRAPARSASRPRRPVE